MGWSETEAHGTVGTTVAETTTTEGTEHKRSAVRRVVTYTAVGTYLALSAVTIVWLLWEKKYDMAIAVLGAVGSMAGSITGFWFGARQPKATTGSTEPVRPEEEGQAGEKG